MTRRARSTTGLARCLDALEAEAPEYGERPLDEDTQKAILDAFADLQDREGERCSEEQEQQAIRDALSPRRKRETGAGDA